MKLPSAILTFALVPFAIAASHVHAAPPPNPSIAGLTFPANPSTAKAAAFLKQAAELVAA